MTEELREATEKDMKLLWEWVNDPLVRKYAFSSQQISLEEHWKWYNNLLKDECIRQYIYEVEGIPVGQVRITMTLTVAEIDYSICKEKRGIGYGKRMIQLLTKKVKKDFPHVRVLLAKVRTENIASQRVFTQIGYHEKYRAYEWKIN